MEKVKLEEMLSDILNDLDDVKSSMDRIDVLQRLVTDLAIKVERLERSATPKALPRDELADNSIGRTYPQLGEWI